MKRLLPLIICLALSAIACTIIEDETHLEKQARFYASLESPSSTSTKVYLDENLKLLWNADDRISIFNKYTFNDEYRFEGNTGDNAGAFTKVSNDSFVTGNDLENIYAVYPYSKETYISNSGVINVTLPEEQIYREGSFGSGANVMVSVTEDSQLRFKNLGGYIAIQVYGNNVSVSSITVKGNNGEKLAGKAIVNATVGGTPTVELANSATETVTLLCQSPVKVSSSAETATVFWFVIPPTFFSNGITVTITDDKGGITEKSTSKSITINRNTLSRMAPIEVSSSSSSSSENPTAVDLGLPSKTLWASLNVGASSLSDIGGRYAWGETETKDYYDWDNYKWCNGTSYSMTKYCTNSNYGTVDGKTILSDEDDVAKSLWGEEWRIPSVTELTELATYCTWTTETLNGVTLVKATGPNGNVLYFPQNGQYDESGITWSTSVFLWSNETPGDYYATRLEIYGSSANIGKNHKHDGLCIRPVYGKVATSSPLVTITLDEAGTLSEKLSSMDCKSIKELTISGLMDARDFDFLKWECVNVEVVDLSGVKIVEYSGAYGTNEGYDYTYPADEIPLGAFFYWVSNYHRVVTDGFSDEGMPSLKKVVLPSGIKAIRRNAFARAYHLTDINFPEGLEDIDYVAFNLDFSLKTLVFPSTLKRIGTWAFYSGNDLQEVHCKALTPPALNDSWSLATAASDFHGWLSDEQRANQGVPVLYVPEESLSLYQQSDWASFFTDIRAESSSESGPGAVDLGLPSGIKWASYNVGATKPEEYGDYFSWGETTPYDYTREYYGPGSDNGGKSVLEANNDAASVILGGTWRIPTAEEWTELSDNCNFVWTSVNGVYGYNVSSKIVGYESASIFLPAAGFWSIGTFYPASTVYAGDYYGAYCTSSANIREFHFTDSMWGLETKSWTVKDGRSIRPVCN